MKKFTMIIALVLMMAMPMLAEHISPETARIVATTFLDNNGAKSIELTDLSEEAGFPNLYIFTADDCFVVMSADDCVKPILGYSLTGNFVVEEMPEGVRFWLQGYSDQIQDAIEYQAKASSETVWQWKALAEGKAGVAQTTTIVERLVKTYWRQDPPFNMLCPINSQGYRTYTGCVATAMAQIMNYWKHPTTGTGSYSYVWENQTLSVNFGNTPYDWNNMPTIINSSNIPTQEQETAVATLMYHCGVSINMEYHNPDSDQGLSSSAATFDVMSALQTYFGYAPNMQYKIKDDYNESLWIVMLKSEFDEGRPVQYRGDDANGQRGGHSFICDGYDSDDNFHINWGSGGGFNGFYTLDFLAPKHDSNNGNYTIQESAIFGIEPINNSLAAPILSATASGNNIITLTWNAIEGATSYDVYKDNIKIGDGITTTTFSDSDTEFGSYYEYYVRAVSSSTTRSNSSNHVTMCQLYRDIKPSDLNAIIENDNITLTWTGYSGGQSTDLHYGTTMSYDECGTGETNDAFWGQRYPVSMISKLDGMTITKVSTCIYYTGDYKLYLYSGNLDGDSHVKLAELPPQHKDDETIEWRDFVFDPPVEIDCTKDLWVVFFADKSISKPILYSIDYNEANVNDAKHISSTLDCLFSSESVTDKPVSWLIRTYISDGNYSYNLYEGNNKINGDNPISGTSYTVNSIPDNAALQYTVKTNYNRGESEASNMVGFIVGDAELETLELDTKDKMTLTEGSKLTVTNTLNSPSIDNLVLENGAQLLTNSKNVYATVKKCITGHGEGLDGGWNFIASPIDGSDGISPVDAGLITDNYVYGDNIPEGETTYDLYYFDQAQDLPWKNYRAAVAAEQPFNLKIGKGYLYANNANKTISFAGTIKPSNEDFSVILACSDDKTNTLRGWHLIGNPFPCNATINMPCYSSKKIEGNNEQGFRLNAESYASGSIAIGPGEAVMVHVDNNDQTVTFSQGNPLDYNHQPKLQLTVMQNVTDRDGVSTTSVEDNAIVSFNEGCQLEKFVFDINASRIYIPKNGRDYAIVTSEGQGEVSVNFRAAENGSYTFTVQPEGVEMNYLRLIDNITGNEVDLLAMPDYTFTAKTTDYPSRFRLLFSVLGNEDDNEANDDFAYYSNGEIRVIEMCNDASLQIVDMTGRVVLFSSDVARNVSTKGMTPGVYVLRLINGNNVKTQKIMVY